MKRQLFCVESVAMQQSSPQISGRERFMQLTDYWLMTNRLLSHAQAEMNTCRVRQHADTFVHCNIPSLLVLLVFSVLYSWLYKLSSNVILGLWLQFSWMLLFQPLCLVFITSYQGMWGICFSHLICFTLSHSLPVAFFCPLQQRKTSEGMHI